MRKYHKDSLNLDNNTRVNQAFDPPTITNVDWELVAQQFNIKTRVLELDVQFTANNFTQQRTFTYLIPENVQNMGVTDMYGLLLSETELKDSTENE